MRPSHATRAINTLGTALGDYVATDTGLGFERGALVFTGQLFGDFKSKVESLTRLF